MFLSLHLGVVFSDGHLCAFPLQIFQQGDTVPSSHRPDFIGQKTFQRRKRTIAEKAQNVGRYPAPRTCDLDAGQKGHVVNGRESLAFRNAIDGVVVAEGHGRQSARHGNAEDLLRVKRCVGGRMSMDVQICSSHEVNLLTCCDSTGIVLSPSMTESSLRGCLRPPGLGYDLGARSL